MIITRKELITSREWWVGHISQRLWEINGLDPNFWEEMAEKVVDEDFMDTIREIYRIGKNQGVIDTHEASESSY